MTVRLRIVAAIVLGSIASAGLFVSTSEDFQHLTPLYIGDVWLLPGLMVIGALLSVAIDDFGSSTVALIIVAVLGSLLYGGVVAAPAFQVDAASTTFIDRGIQLGLMALLLTGLFGFAGFATTWVAGMLLPGMGDKR